MSAEREQVEAVYEEFTTGTFSDGTRGYVEIDKLAAALIEARAERDAAYAAFAGIESHYHAAIAQLAAARVVTDAMVERACADFHGPARWSLFDPEFQQALRDDMRRTLTAALSEAP